MDIQFKNNISFDDYSNLRNDVGWPILSERQFKNIFANSIFFVAGVVDDKTVAMTRVISDMGYIYFLADVIVHSDYQGKGVGRMLVSQALDFIKGCTVDSETIRIELMAAKGKEEFYEKFGFEKRPSDKFGCGMTMVYIK